MIFIWRQGVKSCCRCSRLCDRRLKFIVTSSTGQEKVPLSQVILFLHRADVCHCLLVEVFLPLHCYIFACKISVCELKAKQYNCTSVILSSNTMLWCCHCRFLSTCCKLTLHVLINSFVLRHLARVQGFSDWRWYAPCFLCAVFHFILLQHRLISGQMNVDGGSVVVTSR